MKLQFHQDAQCDLSGGGCCTGWFPIKASKTNLFKKGVRVHLGCRTDKYSMSSCSNGCLIWYGIGGSKLTIYLAGHRFDLCFAPIFGVIVVGSVGNQMKNIGRPQNALRP